MVLLSKLTNFLLTYRPPKTTGKYFSLTATVGSWPLLLSQKYGKSLRMLLPIIRSGWQLSVARWVNQPLTALCYQSQISKFLRENRRNPNLKQDSESSFKSRVRRWNYAVLSWGVYLSPNSLKSSPKSLNPR